MQCPKLGIESFIRNGVRPALIPILINYFQDREMTVKWHGCRSSPRTLAGGGPQGATFGLLEYLAQSNNNADCVSESDRFKFLDDLSVLEIFNLLTVGITSFNLKHQVASDIPTHNQYIPPEHLDSQEWLNNINEWTINQKMLVNERKSKTIIFNYTNNYQFTTRLKINDQPLEVIDSTRLLGTIISNDLKWDLNCANIIKKANARMELLRKVSNFCSDYDDLKNIYFLYIRSLLEQSATVWHSSLSEDNKNDLERVQKSALKLILDDKYQGYKKALLKLDIESLSDRREKLCLNFAIKAAKNDKSKHMFPLNDLNEKIERPKQQRLKQWL